MCENMQKCAGGQSFDPPARLFFGGAAAAAAAGCVLRSLAEPGIVADTYSMMSGPARARKSQSERRRGGEGRAEEMRERSEGADLRPTKCR